ncbi:MULTISPECIES: tetratricopeptide repeat-containing sensor histidine kinase [Flavobacteriaceae]|uniref:Tetratricopeptide repeat protein n=2 Tax=Flavobacteriaceae TaxID=49546 RepID=A0A2T0MAY6_9FLAO|nr:histidine kinase [Allomuricauda pacifica]PRX54670.1 tetratricopeptide repeat protein [Allomuricauda pacifica]
MRIPFTLILLCLSFLGYSQDKEADSIKKLIENYKVVDTNLVNLRQSYAAKKMLMTPSDTTWLSYNKETLELAKDMNYTKGLLLANNNIGVVYHYFLSDPLTALDYYQTAYSISEQNPSLKRYQYSMLTNMGLIHYEQEDYDKALPIFRKLLRYPQRKSNTLSNIGNIYGLQQQTDSAVYYFRASIKEAKRTGDVLQVANVSSNLGLVQAQADQLNEGLANTALSLKMIDSLNLEVLRVPAYVNAAEVYMHGNDLDKAEYYASESLNAVKSLNNLYTETKSLQTLATIQEKKGDYQNALKNYKAANVLNDSLVSTDRKVEISRKEIQYEADKKEALAVAEAERQRAIKNASLVGGGGVILASLFAFISYRRKQRSDTAKKEAEFNATVAEVELKALRAQMNPHFIFNSLNSIGDYILNNNTQAASDYLAKFARLMRMTLENSDKQLITLEEDISLLNTYLAIEQKRFEKAFDFEIRVTDGLDTDEILLPPMLLQPFVENSIVHGLSKSEKGGEILINFISEQQKLICTVEDNGVGRATSKSRNGHQKKNSMGMSITQNRIEVLNKTKGTNGSVKIVDKELGTKVIVSLPLVLA